MEQPVSLAEMARQMGYAYVADPPQVLAQEIVELLPDHFVRAHAAVPLRVDGHGVDVLTADPGNPQLAAELAFALNREVRLLVSEPDLVNALIRRYYGQAGAVENNGAKEASTEAAGGQEITPSAHDLAAMAGQAPVIQFVNQVLARAIREGASDLHFEPFEREFKLRYRVDGVLREMQSPAPALALPVTSRLKVLANLDIAERRLPQDGRIKVTQEGRSVDLRISTLPTQNGESVVLRVLDQAAVQLELSELGLPDDVLAGLRRVIHQPNGLLLVTGPTGSGKTTTLYSGLRAINATGLKLLTVEDPVEFEIEGVMQVPVNPAAGLTFGSALRAFLRHDPDVIMVGEIRDLETAQIAIQAALTGHLVLSTLHTNDAPSAATRLLDMGVEPCLLATTVEAVLAQRLVRRICPHCRIVAEPPAKRLGEFNLTEKEVRSGRFFQGKGCAHCGQSGYRGRMGIFEWLVMSEPLRESVMQKAPRREVREFARQQGMRTLRENALQAVADGATTIEEVAKHL